MSKELFNFAYSRLPAIYRRIIEALKINEQSTNELAVRLHCNPKSASKAALLLRREKIIHVAGWRRSGGGPWFPIYGHGNLPNVRRPEKQTASEISRRSRAKRRTIQKATANVWGIAP